MELKTTVEIVRPRRALPGMGALVSGAYVFTLAGSRWGNGMAGALPLFFVSLTMIVTAFAYWLSTSRTSVGVVGVSKEGVSVDGVQVLRRGEIRLGHFIPKSANGTFGNRVRLVGAKTGIEIAVDDEAQANEVLRSCRMDVDTHVERFDGVARTNSRTGKALWGSMPFAFGLMLLGGILQVPALFIAALLVGVLTPIALLRAHVHVGGDGILIQNRLDTKFIRYADIKDIVATKSGVTLELGGGRSVGLPLRLAGATADEQDRASLIARIRAAMDRGRDLRPAEVGWRLERRNEQPIGAWLRALLDQPVTERDDYRNAALRTEDLLAVLDDHMNASTSARVGAALILSKRGEEERTRIRVAAEASAAPKLRVALQAIAEEKSGAGDAAERMEDAVREAEEETATPAEAASALERS